MREIKLLKKPVSKWTRKEAIIESIKLWAFLVADIDRTKAEYFDDEDSDDGTTSIILSGCFLCEYVFGKQLVIHRRKNPGVYIGSIEACEKFKCCLRDKKLCAFNGYDSAYSVWYEHDRCDEYRLQRTEAAQTILDALKAEYKNITGEEYHE